jgi:multisubunit Na+/H+ antiporter MnhC subunit
MSGELWRLFSVFGFFTAILLACGLYCILVTRSLIRAIIGLELLVKAVTLLLIVCGYAGGKTALAQAFTITVIVIEVVLAVVAGGIALSAYRCNGSLDVRQLGRMKG